MEGLSLIGDDTALGLSSRSRTLGESLFMSRAAQKRFAILEKLGRDAGLGRIFLRLPVTSSGEHVSLTAHGYVMTLELLLNETTPYLIGLPDTVQVTLRLGDPAALR